MKKCFTLFLCTTLCIVAVFAQKNNQKSLLYDSPNSPIDNISHWEDMAKRGIIPMYVPIPVKPATVRSSWVQTPKGLQNSPDVLIIDVSGTTQHENSVFVDPNNRDNALNSNNSFEVGVSVLGANYVLTEDGGLSWAGSENAAGGVDKGDPAACIGLNGRQYIGAINSGRKQVVSWSDDGITWNKVDVVSGTFSEPDLLDKNHLWIDNTNSSQEGNLYNAWTHFETGHANDKELEFSRSTNDGISWSTPINISSGVSAGYMNQGVNIQCNNTGWVFAVWAIHDEWTTGNYAEDAIGFARSGNGGVSFYSATTIVDNIKGLRESWYLTNATGKNMRVNSFPSMAIDVSGGTYHGDIYVVWANIGVPGTNTGTNVSIYMTKSTNGGTIWSTPTRVNTVAASNHAAFFPWITCDPITGNLYVIFYDDRNFSDASADVEAWVAYSDDGGASWADMAVSDVSFTPSPAGSSGYMGDYLGISAYDGKVYPTWTDNRSGDAQTYVSPLDFGCSASGGGYEHISNVQFGTINNSSGSDEYTDYSNLSTNLNLNAAPTITVTNGVTTYPTDQCGIWVDWNRDDDFDDANETISISNTPSAGPYTAIIAPPAGTALGPCKMRIRITYTLEVEPCGRRPYGEVEDYTINITDHAPNEWIGIFNHYWHNSKNWSMGHIPLPDEDVVISSAGYQPVYVDEYTSVPAEICANLTVQSGATLDMMNQTLQINEDLDVNGEIGFIQLSTESAYINVFGNVVWNSGSTLDVTVPNSYINVYGDWNFNSGANVNPTLGFVDFRGTSTKYIRCYSNNCNFYNLRVYKSGGGILGLSAICSEDLVVNNLTYLSTSAIFNSYSSHNIVMKGSFNYYGTFDFTQGGNTSSVIFDGVNDVINNYNSGSGLFNNIVFSSTTSTTLSNDNMTVMGNLTIESGTFNSNGLPVEVHRTWNNTGGTYSPNGSVVTFNGDGFSYPNDVNGTSTFYDIVQLSTGSYLKFNNANIISNNLELHGSCWAYNTLTIGGTLNINDVSSKFSIFSLGDVTTTSLDQGGEIVVSNNCTFLANDLIESGIEGTYHLISGEINLTQDAGSLPDFQADIDIENGQFILNGGDGTSWWAYGGDASLTMSGGIFDFNNAGCNVYASSNTLTLNITGGTIRTAGSFTVANPVFTPSAGLLEFYSTSDGNFSTVPAANVYNVLVNKNTKSGSQSFKLSDRDIAAGIKTGGGSPKAIQVNMTSDVNINGNFTIDYGVFNTNSNDMYVGGDWINNAGTGAFNEGTSAVTFNGPYVADIITDETFYDLVVDKSASTFEALELGAGLTANVLHNLETIDGTLEMNANSTLTIGNDVHLGLGSGLNAFNDLGLSIYVGGNWVNDNTLWNSSFGYSPGTEVITFNGSADQTITTNAPKEDFGNLVIDKSAGQFRPNNNIDIMHDLQIIDGQWSDNVSLLTHYFEGDFEVGPSGAYFTHVSANTAVFKTTSDQNITYNSSSGYFYNIIVDKTDWPVKKAVEGGEINENTIENQSKGPKALSVSLTTNLDMEFGDGLTIEEGILNLNGNTFTTMGDININDGGTIIVNENAILKVDGGDGLYINSGGLLQITGTSGNEATIEPRTPTDIYEFKILLDGTISAEYGIFEGMTTSGVFVSVAGIVDPVHAFNHCTFGNSASGWGAKLMVNNDQDLVSTGVNFPTSSGTDKNAWKYSGSTGTLSFIGASGDFAGPEYEEDPGDGIHWAAMDITIDLTTVLEGPFNGTDMNTDYYDAGVLPLSQPYNVTPWNYMGTENVGSIPAGAVDWVLVELRDADNAASATGATIFETRAAFILNDGSIVDMNGTSPLTFNTSYSNGIYAVIRHINHLDIISNYNLTRSGGVYTYDFSSSAYNAYGGLDAQVQLSFSPVIWGMIAGDGDGDGDIGSADKLNIWSGQTGKAGYNAGDFNLDGQVNNPDKDGYWVPNWGSISWLQE